MSGQFAYQFGIIDGVDAELVSVGKCAINGIALHNSFPDVAPVCSDFELAVRDLFIWGYRLVKQVEQQDDYEHEREPNGQVFVGWIHLILYTFLAFCECSL